MCRRELVIEATSRDAQAIVGEECHIISRKTEGPRYDQDYAAEKIDEVENLILLCAVHHKMVDDQSETYTAEILRKLKANHEAWVRTSLADEKGVPPLKLRRLKENIPSHLLRLTNGRDVLKIVDHAYGFQFDHPEPKSPEEAQFLAEFLQEAQDWGDLSGDLEAGEELQKAGFWVFGGREIRRLEGGISGPSEWPVAILEVRRSTDPEIIKVELSAARQGEEK
jgi:hypothetical protein